MPKQTTIHDRVDFRPPAVEVDDETQSAELESRVSRRRILGAMVFAAASVAMRSEGGSAQEDAAVQHADDHEASSERNGLTDRVTRVLRRQAIKHTVELMTPEEVREPAYNDGSDFAPTQNYEHTAIDGQTLGEPETLHYEGSESAETVQAKVS